MSVSMYAMKRCQLFEDIASKVWNRIIRKHNFGRDELEENVTDDIITDILEYNSLDPKNFDVYAKDGKLEKDFGSDLDLYIEVKPGYYRWFALQAKILKSDNAYHGLNHTSAKIHIKQWVKLRRLERFSRGGCKSYYLLYNGKSTYNRRIISACRPEVITNSDQYGCSLVEVEVIKHFASYRQKGAKRKWIINNPTFENFHPRFARPWRELVCCYLEKNIEEVVLYSYHDIIKSCNNYSYLEGKEIIFKRDTTGGDTDNKNKENNESEDNEIIVISREAKWEPKYKIIVRTTSNLEENK